MSFTHPLLETLPEPMHTAMLARLGQRNVAKGELLAAQGEVASGLWFLASGQLEFQIEHADGERSFIGIAKPGDYLGDCELLSHSPHFATISAQDHCTLWWLPARSFWQAMAESPAFATQVARRMAHRLRLMQQVQAARHHMSLPRQLAGIILHLARHYGQCSEQGEHVVGLKLSRQQLAEMAGTSRQSIHPILQQWQQAGWIDYRYGKLRVLDLPALRYSVNG